MEANGLYARGWRQGSVLTARLRAATLLLSGGGLVAEHMVEHDLWLVASQDCDLDGAKIDNNEPVIELRMVHTEDPPSESGIRSRMLAVTPDHYLVADDPRLQASPAALVALEGQRQEWLPDEPRRVALKTWLGKRYDRPAVPDEWLPLAKRIALEVKKKKYRETTTHVRDVLMQFEEGDPARYSLIAVVTREADSADVRRWLADVAAGVPNTLGVADDIRVGTADQVALSVIETSYAADVTQVTWQGDSPEGAY